MFFRDRAVQLTHLSFECIAIAGRNYTLIKLDWKSQELLMALQSILLHIYISFLQLILIVQN